MSSKKASRRRYLRLLGLTGMGVLAGCSGDGGDGGGTDTATGTTATTPAGGTDTMTPTATLTPTPDTTTPTTTLTPTPDTTTPTTTETDETQTTTEPDQASKLTAADGDTDDNLGWALALADTGTTALVGAYNDEDPNGYGEDPFGGSGSAYVFTHDSGSWSQQAKLAADDGDAGDWFAESVALADAGGTALVGAPRDEGPNGSDAGSAYVFTRNGGSWSQQTKLTPDDGDSGDQFGQATALTPDGRAAFVGGSGDEDPNGSGAGSAYVFTKSGGSWSQSTKLTPDDGAAGDRFGGRITATNGTVIITAVGDESATGAAYVFTESDGIWSQDTKLTADDGDSSDRLGVMVDISTDGTTALVSAPGDEDPNGSRAGSAYVFTGSGGSWSQSAKLTPDDGDSRDRFAEGVALNGAGSTAVIGARNDEDPNGSGAGSAYLFSDVDGTWSQQAKLTADDGDSDDSFGSPAALADGTALLGSYKEEAPNGTGAGAVYVFSV